MFVTKKWSAKSDWRFKQSRYSMNREGRARRHDPQLIFCFCQLAFDRPRRNVITGQENMNRYNKLKIRTLSVFALAPEAWFKGI
jgi:hypothetical protein